MRWPADGDVKEAPRYLIILELLGAARHDYHILAFKSFGLVNSADGFRRRLRAHVGPMTSDLPKSLFRGREQAQLGALMEFPEVVPVDRREVAVAGDAHEYLGCADVIRLFNHEPSQLLHEGAPTAPNFAAPVGHVLKKWVAILRR